MLLRFEDKGMNTHDLTASYKMGICAIYPNSTAPYFVGIHSATGVDCSELLRTAYTICWAAVPISESLQAPSFRTRLRIGSHSAIIASLLDP